MACFCGCETFEKNPDGFKIGCMKCGHERIGEKSKKLKSDN